MPSDPSPPTASDLLDSLERAPRLAFPHGALRYQQVYHILAWELLRILNQRQDEDTVGRAQVIAALTKAAGELTVTPRGHRAPRRARRVRMRRSRRP